MLVTNATSLSAAQFAYVFENEARYLMNLTLKHKKSAPIHLSQILSRGNIDKENPGLTA